MNGRIDALREAFDADPGDHAAFLALVEALLQRRDLEALVEIYRSRANSVDAEEALYLYLTIADVWSQRLGMPGLATEALFQAYAMEPSPLLRDRLHQHLLTQRDWTMLARLLDMDVDRAETDVERGRALLRFAHFLRERMHDVGEAARVYLKAANASEETFMPAVISLRRFRRAEPNSAEVARALATLLGHSPNPDKMLQALEDDLDRLPESQTRERADIMLQMARVYLEGLGDTKAAFARIKTATTLTDEFSDRVSELLSALVDAAPDNLDALQFLRERELAAGRVQLALDLARRELDMRPEPESRADVLLEIGDIIARHLDDRPRAVTTLMEAYRLKPAARSDVLTEVHQLLVEDPTDEIVRNAAIELLEAAHDSDGLARLWDRVAEVAESSEERAEALWRKGRIELEMGRNPHAALKTWSQAAGHADDVMGSRMLVDIVELYDVAVLRNEVVATVRELAGPMQRWDVLADLLARHAELQSSSQARARTLRELGRVLLDELDEPQRAVSVYRTAFQVDPEDPEIVSSLRRAYVRLGETEQARGLLEFELRLVTDPARRAGLLVERARLDLAAGDAASVIRSYGEVLEAETATGDGSDRDQIRAAIVEAFTGAEGPALLKQISSEGAVTLATSGVDLRHLRAVANLLAESDDERAEPAAVRLFTMAHRAAPAELDHDELRFLFETLEANEAYEALADALQLQIRTTLQSGARAALVQRLEQLAEAHPDSAPLQQAHARMNLELDPTPERFEALVALYQDADNFDALSGLYEWSADGAPWVMRRGVEARVEMLHRAAAVAEEELDDAERVEALMRRVLEFDRNDEDALDWLRRYYVDAPLAFYQLLAPSAPAATTPATRAARQAELAQLSQDAIGDIDRAVFHWNQVLGVEDAPPELREQAYAALRSLYLGRERHEELIDLIRSQVHAAETDLVRIDYLWELVTLQRETSHDVEGARRTLERILRIAPDEPRALASLAELEHGRGNFERAAEHLRHLVDVTDGEQQRRHRLRLVRLLSQQLGEWRSALDALAEALREVPLNESAIRELAHLLLEPGPDQEARHKAWVETVDARIEEIEGTHDPDLADARRQLLELRAHVLTDELGDVERAMEAWQALIESDATSIQPVLALGALIESERPPAEAATHYSVHAARLATRGDADPSDIARLHALAGDVHATRRDDPEDARVAYRHALDVDDTSVEALRGLLRVEREFGDSETQLGLVDRLLELTSDEESRSLLLLEKAALHEDLGNLEAATNVIEERVRRDPLDEAALHRLQSLYQRQGRLDGLAEVLGRLAGLADDDEQHIAWLMQRAKLLEMQLSDPSAALDVYDQILAAHPRHVPALEAAARIRRRLGRYAEALEALEVLVRADEEDKAGAMLKIAEVYEEMGDEETAFARYRLAYETDPDDERAMLAMWRLGRTSGFWPELIDVLEQAAMETDVPAEQARLLREVAELTENKLEDARRAFHVLRMAHQIDPAGHEMLHDLERLAQQGDFWFDLAVVYRNIADVAESPDEQIRYLHKVADLTAQQMRNPEGAFDVLQEVLDEYPKHRPTWDRLQSLVEDHGLWELRLELEEGLIEQARGPTERLPRLIRAASIARDRLDDFDRAAAYLLDAVRLAPADEHTAAQIATLEAGMDPWPGVVAALEEELSTTARDDDARITIALRIAEIHEHRRGDPERAWDVLMRTLPLATDERVQEALLDLGDRLGRLEEAAAGLQDIFEDTLDRERAILLAERRAELLEHAGNLPLAVEALRRILELDPSREEAARRLHGLTVDDAQVRELLRTLETQAERIDDPEARAHKHIEIARVLETRDRLVEAADAYKRALRDLPDSLSAWRRLLWIAKRLERWDDAREALETILERNLEPERAREDTRTLASIWSEHLDAPDTATSVLTRWLEAHPDDFEVMHDLESLLHQAEDWSRLMSLYQRQAQSAPDPRERRRCLFEHAVLAYDEFQNLPLALESLETLAETGDDPRVLDRLARIYRELERWEDAMRTMRRIVSTSESDTDRARALWNLAQILSRHLDDTVAALDVLDELVLVAPEQARGWLRRADLFETLGRYVEARDALAEAAELLDGRDAARVWVRIGDLLRDQLESLDLAADAYGRALQIEPTQREAASALARLAEATENPEQQLHALEHQLEQVETPEERARLLWRRGKVLRDGLENFIDAEETFLAALEAKPDHYASLRDAADLFFSRAKWDRARELYERLQKATRPTHEDEQQFPRERLGFYLTPDDPDWLITLVRLAICAERLDDQLDAARVYRAAHERRPGHTAVLLGLCRCYYRTGNWARARQYLEQVVERLEQLELRPRDRAHIHYYLGDIRHASNQLDEALEQFELALDANPNYRPAADQKLAVLIEQKAWAETVPAFYHLLRLTEDVSVRGAIFKRLGEVHAFFLDEPFKAIAAYEQAMVHGGEDTFDVPQRLLDLYVTHELWEKAQVTAEALIEESGPSSPSAIEFRIVLGDILLRGLGEPEAALETYRAAYEAAPDDLVALERLGEVYASRGDLEALADLYSDHLTRLDDADSSTRADVLERYGAQLVEVSDAPREAIAVYQNLTSLIPRDAAVHRRLAALFAHSDVDEPRLELEHLRRIVELRAFDRDDLLRLVSLYERVDAPVGRASIVSLIRFADGEDDPVPGLESLDRGELTGRVYESELVHPYARGPLGRLFEHLDGLGLDEALAGSRVALEADGIEDLTRRTGTPAVAIFEELRRAMNLDHRELYTQKGSEVVPVRVIAGTPPALVFSDELLKRLVGPELKFVLAFGLELSRPRFLIASALSALELLTLMRTVLGELSRSRTPRAKPSLVERRTRDHVRAFLSELRSSHSIEIQEDLEGLVEEVMQQHTDDPPSARRYVTAARATAIRVALIACGSQTASLRYLLKRQRGHTMYRPDDFDDFVQAVSETDDLAALVNFIVSDEHITAQKAIQRTTPETVAADGPQSLAPTTDVSDVVEESFDTGLDSVFDGIEGLAEEAVAALDSATEALAAQTAPVDSKLVEREAEPTATQGTAPGTPDRVFDDAVHSAIGSLDELEGTREDTDLGLAAAATDEPETPTSRAGEERPQPSTHPGTPAANVTTSVDEVIDLGELELEPLDTEPPESPEDSESPRGPLRPMPPRPPSRVSTPPETPVNDAPLGEVLGTSSPTSVSDVIELDPTDLEPLESSEQETPPEPDHEAAARVLTENTGQKPSGERTLDAPRTSTPRRSPRSSGILPTVSPDEGVET